MMPPEEEGREEGLEEPRASPPTLAEAPASNGVGPPVTKIQRTVEILRVLQKHQFFQLLRELNQAQPQRTVGRTEVQFPKEAPRRVRMMLQDMGPTFIKVGQLLGTRPDLVPREFANEFKKLYDQTTPNPFPEVREVVEEELGKPIEEVFDSFDEQPVASASIGQVHFATLKTGERVAVKVQHPGIEERIALDFEILEPIVAFIERVFAGSRIWQPKAHLEELRTMLGKELDYSYEAHNHQRVYQNFRNYPGVKIPQIHWDYSGKRVLTLEYIDGIKLEDLDEGGIPHLDGESVARVITEAMGKQIFEDRIFHADPSPGNLLILDSHTVAFLDFGAVGIVTRRRAERVLGLLGGFMRDDLDMVAQNIIELTTKTGEFDPAAFRTDLERIMEFHEQERASAANPRMLDMIIDIAEQHNMLLPPDFMLITRSLFQFEGMCRRLDPNYELVEVLGPSLQEMLFRRYTDPSRQKDAMIDIGIQTAELIKAAPGRVNNILRKLDQDELAMNLHLQGMDAYQESQHRNVLRASTAGIAGAVILAAGIIIGLGQSGDLLRFGLVATIVVLLWLFGLLWMNGDT
ncbi:MAG: AarF/UbiB family protein [Candidatus Thermoplasmatota archaeon]|nr:AarF/UbiB family protein [Candidatus Thermoplasmatota archaeon]